MIDKYINKMGIYDLELKCKVDRKTIWRRIENEIQNTQHMSFGTMLY